MELKVFGDHCQVVTRTFEDVQVIMEGLVAELRSFHEADALF